MKNFHLLRYFHGIEVARFKKSFFSLKESILHIYWKKYVRTKPIYNPMHPNICFKQHLRKPLADSGQYQWLIGQLVDSSVIRLELLLISVHV